MLLNRFICFDSEDSAKLRQLAAQVREWVLRGVLAAAHRAGYIYQSP
jgi:hypothetical protein